MQRIINTTLICLFFLSFSSTDCLGQTESKDFYLKDGTIIQGKIVAQDESIIVVNTQYGTLEIQKNDIVKQEPTKQLPPKTKESEIQTILMKDGTTIKGIVTFENEDSLIVETSYGIMNIPKSNVKPSEKKFVPKTKESKEPDDKFINERKLDSRYWPGGGSTLIGGSVGFSLTRMEGSDESLILLSLVPKAIFFMTKGFGFGFDLSIVYVSAGNTSQTTTAIGPVIMGAFGDKESSAIPYISFGLDYLTGTSSYETSEYYSYNTSSSTSGFLLKLSVGEMIKIGQNLGLPIEFVISYTSVERDNMTVFGLGIGVAGLLY